MKTIIVIFLFISFASTTSAVVFNCVYKNISFGYGGTRYACTATSVTEITNQIATNAVGIHATGKSNLDVEGIWIHGCWNLKFIPTGISRIFPNLLAHWVYNCPIEKIVGNELFDFTNLKYASVSWSQIERVPGNYFSTNPGLLDLGFSNNPKLAHVARNLLEPVKNATFVNFLKNLCINKSVSTLQIPTLIEDLKTQCPDSCPSGYESERICQLEGKISDLLSENEELKESVNKLREEFNQIKAIILPAN